MAESTPQTAASEKSGYERMVPIIQNLGIVVGGLGSLAALFFWIGNVIIISRLREYNLYGIVHYTDEYVKEAGYQFLQDIFSFFRQPGLIALAVALVAGIIVFMPLGPFKQREPSSHAAGPGVISGFLTLLKERNVHYVVFFLIAFCMTLALALDWGARNLAADITADAATLQAIIKRMDDADQRKQTPVFVYTKGTNEDKFEARFIEDLAVNVRPSQEWVLETLRRIGYVGKMNDPGSIISEFQGDFGIKEVPDTPLVDKEGKESETYRKLREIDLSQQLNAKLYKALTNVRTAFVSMLQGNLDTPDDYSSLVLNPANFSHLNDLVRNLKILQKNASACFQARNEDAKAILSDISTLTPIRLGSSLIVASFLTMLGILMYLFMNLTKLRSFDLLEKGYYFLMTLLFITLSITLPTVYGKYNFEFKIQRVTDIDFNEQGGGSSLKQKFSEYLKDDKSVYVLGPTRDKEVIISTIVKKDVSNSVPQIIIMDRSAIKYIRLEPVSKQEIPGVVRLLKRSSTL